MINYLLTTYGLVVFTALIKFVFDYVSVLKKTQKSNEREQKMRTITQNAVAYAERALGSNALEREQLAIQSVKELTDKAGFSLTDAEIQGAVKVAYEFYKSMVAR